jgi:ATP/maltotriose-dependent transcriptional regulator MalT
VLVGRAAESRWLKRRVALARRSEGGAVLLAGDPGVGKTTLVGQVSASARGFRVLRAVGVESEASLGYSVLADICRPVLGLLDRVPGPQAAALQAALALGPAVPLDRFAVFAGALSLLTEAAARQPLLAWVDDAHWVDAESAGALGFCARRIYAEPVLLVLAAREGEPLPFPADAFEQLALGGLDAGASAELLAAARGRGVDRRVAERLHAATAGNPLALIEIGALLSDAQLAGRAPLDEPLRVGSAVERLFWRQVARQPPAVQGALLLAAASDTGSTAEIARALPAAGLAAGDLEHAESAGLASIADGRVEFKHPLLRAVVYRSAAARDRRAAHRALAGTVTGPDAPLRRAWHRASAATGPDESIAQELEQVGTQMAARTGYAAAASAFERAAALSDNDDNRARRLLAAGHAAYLAGIPDRARDAARTAAGHTGDPLLRADCAHLRANVEVYAGNVLDAHRRFLDAAQQIAPYDRARETQFLIDAVVPLFNAGEVNSAHHLAQRACQRAKEIGGETEVLARKVLAMTMILRGDGPAGYPLMLEGLELEAQQPASVQRLLVAHWGVMDAVWMEDYGRARAVLSTLLEQLRDASALTPLAYTLSVLSELEFRTGNWAAALAAASEAVSIAAETGQRGTAAYSLVTLARAEAAVGREQAAREHADQALGLAGQAGTGSITTYARAALGLLELGLSRPDRACEQLAPLPELTLRQGLGEPGAVCWQPDWIEANIRLGYLEQAEQALTRLTREASRVNRTWALAAAARYRGLLAPRHNFEQHFAQALALHERTLAPFELARTQLCLGERLRRAGERRRARDHLEQALQAFRRLGAQPWVSHAESELSAAGAILTRSADSCAASQPHQLLTAQELQVAIAVGEGKTNKEAAAALFVSPKTIEFHLDHIYRKLGIHSRTQLAREMFARPQTTISPAASVSRANEKATGRNRI